MLEAYSTRTRRRQAMDWDLAIERQGSALRRIIASLFALARLPADATTAPVSVTLPRHLYHAALMVLRPAESALRRLIIVVACDVVVVLSKAERDRIARAQRRVPAQLSKTGIFVNGRFTSPGDLTPTQQPRAVNSGPRTPSFDLFDPLKRFGPARRHKSQWHPRIVTRFDRESPPAPPKRKPVSPNDPVSARRLCRRLLALKTALDDLPGQAQRLARWRALRSLSAGRARRLSPLRPGLPPGHRQRSGHAVDMVLSHCHGLAIEALLPNTS